jgi:integrative and conjugative element protein (TIGR02256 family)
MYNTYINPLGLKVKLPETVFEIIKTETAKQYPNECGGIFVGRVVGDEATIEKTMTLKKYRSTPVLFKRIAHLFNRWLTQIFKESNGETIYLGEWHSHPDSSPNPSSTDFKAMKSIATRAQIRIKTPLLLIVGYRPPNFFAENFYVFLNDKLIPYAKEEEPC